MNNNFIKTILNQTNFSLNDKPHFFPNLIPNVQEYITWEDIEYCMNTPQLFDFEVIGPNNHKVDVPEYHTKWRDKPIQDKKFLFDCLKQGHGLACTNYGSYSQSTNELLNEFEKTFNVHSAIHVYYGLGNYGSFKIHSDFPPNFIIQSAGETHWKVYAERQSVLNDITYVSPRESDLTKVIDVVLKPGDVLYIPARVWHIAMPSEPRLSMSIPCWPKFTGYNFADIDRNYYNIF